MLSYLPSLVLSPLVFNSIVQWVSFCFHVRVTPVQILRSVFSFQIAFAVEDAEEKADVLVLLDPFDDEVAVDGTAGGASCFDFFCDSVCDVSFLFDMIDFNRIGS